MGFCGFGTLSSLRFLMKQNVFFFFFLSCLVQNVFFFPKKKLSLRFVVGGVRICCLCFVLCFSLCLCLFLGLFDDFVGCGLL